MNAEGFVSAGPGFPSFKRKKMPSPADHSEFYSQLGKLLGAGFDIRKAAIVLEDTDLPRGQQVLWERLKAGLASGGSIAGSFGASGPGAGGIEQALIAAGERGGRLAEALGHLAEYFDLLAAARRQVVRGLVYPVIVLHLAIVTGVYLLPKLSAAAPAGSPGLRLLLVLGGLYLVIGVVGLLVRWGWRRAADAAGLDQFFGRVPWLGRARRDLAMARFCAVYHSGLLAAAPMSSLVRLAADASGSGGLRGAGLRLGTVAARGGALGPAFRAETAFPKAFSRSYATGEEAGTLDRDLANWARHYRESAATSIRAAASMLPKPVYFLVVVLVVWQVTRFYEAQFSVLDEFGRASQPAPSHRLATWTL